MSITEEIKKYPVLALVPIAGLFWLVLRNYPGGITIIPTMSSMSRSIPNNIKNILFENINRRQV